ncbi:MAG: hypothetical protein V7731_22160 [Amphritea sp.]
MTNRNIAVTELELIYDSLAEAIDQAGVEKRALYLTKLALILSAEVNNKGTVLQAIEDAALDL